MTDFATIGAAVIGTGFIGSVHVQALRRLGVRVRVSSGPRPAAGRSAGRELGVAGPTPRSTSFWPTRPSTWCTSPRPTTRITRR
jgi:predicted dehydrogenase